MVDECFKLIRKNLRNNGKNIVDHIKRNHFDPWNFANEKDICSFCGAGNKLTKEHVLPKWSFQNDPESNFITKINNTSQTFIKTSIPACSACNNDILSKIESYIKALFMDTNLSKDYFEYNESLNIIRWLELIDYKFQVLNFRRKFLRNQSNEYVPFLKDVPMSVMRMDIDLSPYKALSQLRNSQTRLRRKEKNSRYFSLVFYKSKNKQSHFLHTMDKFIFLEFPEYQMAMFYFFNEIFENNFAADKQAKQII